VYDVEQAASPGGDGQPRPSAQADAADGDEARARPLLGAAMETIAAEGSSAFQGAQVGDLGEPASQSRRRTH
jgi:hypothetical protein